MNHLTAKCLSKGTEKLAADLNLAPGKYSIDETITVRIQGTVTKSADETYTPTISIPHKMVLALFVEKMGAVSPNVQGMLLEAMTEALKAGEKAEGAVADRIRDIEAAEEKVTALLGKLPEATRNGKTVCKITVEEIVLQTT